MTSLHLPPFFKRLGSGRGRGLSLNHYRDYATLNVSTTTRITFLIDDENEKPEIKNDAAVGEKENEDLVPLSVSDVFPERKTSRTRISVKSWRELFNKRYSPLITVSEF